VSGLFQLQAATLAARERTGDKTIGTRVDSGRVQVVSVTYSPRGRSTAVPLSDWLPAADAVRALEAMQ
jgi:hypothetical protein